MMYLFFRFLGKEETYPKYWQKIVNFYNLKEGEGRRECIVTTFLFNYGFVDFTSIFNCSQRANSFKIQFSICKIVTRKSWKGRPHAPSRCNVPVFIPSNYCKWMDSCYQSCIHSYSFGWKLSKPQRIPRSNLLHIILRMTCNKILVTQIQKN